MQELLADGDGGRAAPPPRTTHSAWALFLSWPYEPPAWRRRLIGLAMLAGLVAAVIIFPVIYQQHHDKWTAQRQRACESIAAKLDDAFAYDLKVANILSTVVKSYVFEIETPVLNKTQYQRFARDTVAASLGMVSMTYVRQIFDKDRAAYEAANGPIIDADTSKVSTKKPFYFVGELNYALGDLPYGRIMDASGVAGSVEGYYYALQTGELAITEPWRKPDSLFGPKKWTLAVGIGLYSNGLPDNASFVDRTKHLLGGLAIECAFWKYIAVQGPTGMILKMVEVTKPERPLPLYVSGEEIASNRNWTRSEFSNRAPVLRIQHQRSFEVWCRPVVNKMPFPMTALIWTVAAFVLGCVLAQTLWLQVSYIERHEKDYRDALVLTEQLRRAALQAEQHSGAKSAFLASVSHEIRTPLAGVLGMLGLLLDTTTLTPVQTEYASTALSSGKALLSLVSDVLDLSKIEAGCMEIENVIFSVTDELDGVLSMFSTRCHGKPIELAALVQDSMPRRVVGDPNRFRQIIINLVGNAIKFCNKGHILVRVAAIPEDENTPALLSKFHAGELCARETLDKGQLKDDGSNEWQTLSGSPVADSDCVWERLSLSIQKDAEAPPLAMHPTSALRILAWVEDSGIGIAKSAVDRIFQAFRQADSSTSRMYGGTGIGLNISKQLIELMSGQLTFTSREGKGTTFRLDILVGSCPETSVRPQKPPVLHPLSPTRAHSKATRPPLGPDALPAVDAESAAAKVADKAGPATRGSPLDTGNGREHLEGPLARPHNRSFSNFSAVCIDNNPVRAEVTAHYLRRLGVSVETLILEGSEVWRGGDPVQLSVSSEARGDCHVTFLELSPGAGGWSAAESVPAGGVNGLAANGAGKWSRNWLRGLRLAATRLDPRLARVPFLLLSSEQDAELDEAARLAGFAGVITKPLRETMINARIAEILGIQTQGCSAANSGKTGSLPAMFGDDLEGMLELLKGKCFMVVDDNPVNRKVASKVLEKYGIKVTCKSSGKEAVSALTGPHDFLIIFMDIQMPGMNGHEATRQIRSLEAAGHSTAVNAINKSRVPILAMTADVLKGTWEECTRAGMDAFVTKPIEESRLLQVVTQFLPSGQS